MQEPLSNKLQGGLPLLSFRLAGGERAIDSGFSMCHAGPAMTRPSLLTSTFPLEPGGDIGIGRRLAVVFLLTS